MKKKMLKIHMAETRFDIFAKEAKKLGFLQVPHYLEQRDIKFYGLIPPDLQRIRDTEFQTIFKLELDGYAIRVVTSYDGALGGFTKSGRIWIHVVTPDTKKGLKILLTRHFKREGEFLKNALKMMEYLRDRLFKRPLCKNNKLMVLYHWRSSPTKENRYMWVPERGSYRSLDKVSFFFHGGIPWRLRTFVRNWMDYIYEYENVTREKRGIKVRAKDKRIKWEREKKARAKK